jgi:asparagine synthetase B (glutamine-hydrolysing)
LLRSDGLRMPVGQVRHHTEQATTVYNVEVADWHTYLVSWWMFVVHNTTICLAEIKRMLLARRYLREVENLTKLKVHPKQLVEIKAAIKNKKYAKLTAEETAKSRVEFNSVKNALIEKWEKETGQIWPKYEKDVLSKKGNIYIKKGDKFDAHHLIENTHGGEHEWWNIHPARNPDIHQAGIHGKNAISRILFKK